MLSSTGGGRFRAAGNIGTTSQGAPDAWQATRAQTALATQFVEDAQDYLAPGEAPDIGRQTGANERELFVSCGPTEAMQQQFDHRRPEFIAVHDIATHSSRKLLAGVGAAAGRPVQRLTIRRQGYGTSLAALEYVELPTSDGRLLRMYSTDIHTDEASRQGLARLLLAYSRLGVMMVGDVPPERLTAEFDPLRDAMAAGPWFNRNLLLLPLASAANVVSFGVDLTRGTSVNVRTTPRVTRPADAWNFISGTWLRMRQNESNGDAAAPVLDALNGPPAAARRDDPPLPSDPIPFTPPAPTQPAPLTMRPMPIVETAADKATRGGMLQRYVNRLVELPGMVSCCVFDVAKRRPLAHAGASPGEADLTFHGADLLGAIGAASRTLGFGHALPEVAITLGSHHLLLRSVPRHPGCALHAVLDKVRANLTLARLQVQRLDALFDEPPPA